MAGRLLSMTAIAAVGLFICCSCSREKKADVPTAPASATPVSPLVFPPVDPQVTKAVGALHDTERAWLAQSPAAAAAFKRLTESHAAYQGMIGKFGLYAGAARERAAQMKAVMTAREKQDAAALETAAKALTEAHARVEEAEAKLRLGNPPLQKAYDEWVTARKAYAELRAADEAIAKASAEVARMTERGSTLERDRSTATKEN